MVPLAQLKGKAELSAKKLAGCPSRVPRPDAAALTLRSLPRALSPSPFPAIPGSLSQARRAKLKEELEAARARGYFKPPQGPKSMRTTSVNPYVPTNRPEIPPEWFH